MYIKGDTHNRVATRPITTLRVLSIAPFINSKDPRMPPAPPVLSSSFFSAPSRFTIDLKRLPSSAACLFHVVRPTKFVSHHSQTSTS